MFRRSALSMLLVAGLAVTGAACGGGGSSSADSSTSTPSASGAGDAQAVLASIRTNVGDLGPQKISVKFSATISGSPKDPTLGAFLTKPITLTLDGPVDSKGKKADLTFEVAAGPIKVDGGFRQVGDDSFVEVNGKWYSIPAGALSSATGSSGGSTTTTSPSVDPQAILGAFGDPKKLFTNAKLVGTEDVDGIKSDHVQGDVDLAALVQGIAAVAKSSGSSAVCESGVARPDRIVGQLAAAVREVRDRRPVGRSGRQAAPPLRDDDRWQDRCQHAGVVGHRRVQHHAGRVCHADLVAVGLGSLEPGSDLPADAGPRRAARRSRRHGDERLAGLADAREWRSCHFRPVIPT